METILSLPIIPLVNGSVVALSENTVFFSAGKRSPAGKNASASMQAALTVLEQDIPTVHPDVLRSLDGVQNASVKRMLENMGVKHISSEDVIKKHVLPCFASGKWKEKSTDLLLAYVQLIKEQWTSDKQSLNMQEVRRVIQVQLTSGHFVNPQDTTVQLSVEYLSMFDLPSMFPEDFAVRPLFSTVGPVLWHKCENVISCSGTWSEPTLFFAKFAFLFNQLNPSVESTELALAFPLQTDGKTSQGEPPKQDVFAFLPLRCFGFKFVVQGDFEIPASRQDILQDRQWNQWLRSHLPELFVDSLDCFQKHPEFDKISAVVAFLKHVPLEGELYDFFQPVAKQILQLLQGMPCLPVRKEEGSEWKTPTEIVMCKHKGTVEIVSPELLQKYLGKYYLDQAVQKSVSSVLLKNLGVCSIEVKEVVEVLRGVLKDQLNSGRELTILDSALWLACLYHHLEKTPADDYHVTMETILSLPIIPLVNGSVVALSENTVFFSAGKRSPAGKNASMCTYESDV
ncbi:uncharacterized protein LOC106162634 [Lingula anatina]|uniref:Uncharacterized protein LOC106162634 n=1 Tax=Lingula anatina TaxID=7574 RepID=A0A1S3IAY9_LINAN|nr:uncharacterized protein LOC106162634 [Lingula anatina]|eukprot:XP_013395427.1 uncharacterized protein LOC106162634 [Lingula anatina]